MVDYSQRINKFTRLDAYPLPRIDDLVYKSSRFRYYSSLDLKSAYHKIPIRNEKKPYTVFEAIMFGVANGIVWFQRTMDNIIRQHNLCGTCVYVDYIGVARKAQQEHDKNLEKFRKIVEPHKHTFNKKKSIISTKSINFLGYKITRGSLAAVKLLFLARKSCNMRVCVYVELFPR